MQEEEARRLAYEEEYETRKPKDKNEKRFLRVIAYFDELLFKESLLGEPVREGDKSATLPFKFRLQGEGIFVALFFHVVSLALYVLFLMVAFWAVYDPQSSAVNREFFSSSYYRIIVAVMEGLILSAVPLMMISRYVIYPEGYLFVRIHNFLIGYWTAIIVLLVIDLFKVILSSLKGFSFAAVLMPKIYHLIDAHPKGFLATVLLTAVAGIVIGIMLMLATRKDYLNAIGLVVFTVGAIFATLAALLFKYGYSPTNAKWLIYYLANFLLQAFSEKLSLLALLIPLATYFLFRRKVRELRRKMYEMPYS